MSYSTVKEAAKDLTKLALNGSPKWRVGVTVFIVGLCFASMWGYVNYARASEVDSIKADVRDMKAIFVAQSIITAKRNQCEAIANGRNAVAWTERLQQLRDEYGRLTAKEFPLLDCSEV